MTSSVKQTQPNIGVPQQVVTPDPCSSRLQFEFVSDEAARAYVSALASLLRGGAESCLVLGPSSRSQDDLVFSEINHRIKTETTLALQFLMRAEDGAEKIAVELDCAGVISIKTRVPLDATPTSTTWLQADAEHFGPLPVLALPVHGAHLAIDALHPLVGLGARTGGLLGARLHVEGESAARFYWTVDGKFGDALPVVASHDASVWAPVGGTSAAATSELWFAPGLAQPGPVQVSTDWWSRFDDLTRAAATSPAELESHLRKLVPGTGDWRLDDVSVARHADFMVPVEDGLVMALVPKANEVVVALDLHLPAEVLQPLLLHAMAHLALGHVRPGDKWGHWDTQATATSAEPHRHWDREVKDFVARHLRRHIDRRIESLDECTPTEKDQLGLWRMIGEMLGETRPAAGRQSNAVASRPVILICARDRGRDTAVIVADGPLSIVKISPSNWLTALTGSSYCGCCRGSPAGR